MASGKRRFTSERELKLVRVGSCGAAGHLRRTQTRPGGDVVPFVFDVGSFLANDTAGLFAGNGGEEHANAEADADPGQERRIMGAAAAGGEVGGDFLSQALGVAAFAEQVVHRGPYRRIRSKKAEFQEESDPVGPCMPFGQCTHSNFFPRGGMRWVYKTIYSWGE